MTEDKQDSEEGHGSSPGEQSEREVADGEFFAGFSEGTSGQQIGDVEHDGFNADRDLSEFVDQWGQDGQSQLAGYTYLVEQAEDGLYMLDGSGRFTIVNQAMLDLTGYERDEIVGGDPRLILDDDNFQQFNERVRTTMQSDSDSGSMLTTIVTRNGQKKPVEVRFGLIPTDDESYGGVVGVARDIRVRRHREQKLDVLSRVLRHNIRNKLNLISGHASLIQEAGGEQFQQPASQIIEAADELMQLSEKARTAQTEVGFNPANEHQTDLVEISQHLAVQYRREYPEATVKTNLPPELYADVPTSYRIAVSELIENAIEHNPSPNPRVEFNLVSASDEIRTIVDDYCPPIRGSDVEALNEGEETPLMHSLGIGLWLANWVADTLGGELTLSRREDDSGNRATILLYERH